GGGAGRRDRGEHGRRPSLPPGVPDGREERHGARPDAGRGQRATARHRPGLPARRRRPGGGPGRPPPPPGPLPAGPPPSDRGPPRGTWDLPVAEYRQPRLAFAPDGDLLAVAPADGTVRVYDAGTGEERRVLTGAEGRPSALAFSPDGRRLAEATEQGIRDAL